MQSEGKESTIKLLFSDKTLLIISVQSIHQVAELSITLGSKVIQEEDFAGNRILHRVTKSADLVDNVAEHLDLSVRNCVSTKCQSDVEHITIQLDDIYLRVIPLHTVASFSGTIILIEIIYKRLIITTLTCKFIQS